MNIGKNNNSNWLDTYDKGTPNNGGKTINIDGKSMDTNSEEYRKLYNTGQIQNSKADGEKNPYWGGELDEVVIQNNYKRERGFWEQSRDKYIKEHNQDGLLGALGSVVTYPLGVAQDAMMYATTGKVQKPSDKLGYKNPKGFWQNTANIGEDMVLDPIVLTGLASKIPEGLKTLKEEGILGNIYGKNFQVPEIKNWSEIGHQPNNMVNQTSDLSKDLIPYISKKGNSKYVPFIQDDYMKLFNEQKLKKNPLIIKKDPRSILRNSSIVDINGTPISKPFKSEINWENWNKEIPKNNTLIQEYNIIEQQAKNNSTWMKNSDGSKFSGSPEQFVQQNSENFKKAFNNTKVRDSKGNIQIAKHTTNTKFDEFDINKFGSTTDNGFYGKGSYFHPKTNDAGLYGNIEMQTYLNIQNPAPKEIIPFFGRSGRGKMSHANDFHNNELLWKNKYDGVIADKNYLENLYTHFNDTEYVTNIPTNIKSATGNNGMFDMNNPNIYKSVLPGAIGVGAATQLSNQKAYGGEIENPSKDKFGNLNNNWLNKYQNEGEPPSNFNSAFTMPISDQFTNNTISPAKMNAVIGQQARLKRVQENTVRLAPIEAALESRILSSGMTREDYFKDQEKRNSGADAGLDGLQDPNFNPTRYGISKEAAKQSKKDWKKKAYGGELNSNWLDKYK